MNGNTDGAPKWLDAAFLADILKVDTDTVTDVQVSPAVAAGSNYCSSLWRARAFVKGEQKPQSFIVKTLPSGEIMVDFVTNLGLFRREMHMYNETLPRLTALGAKRCGTSNPLGRPMSARSFPCHKNDVFVLEDLNTRGFHIKQRQKQLDLAHCKVALTTLARLHALSVALHDEDPTSMEQYGESMFNLNSTTQGRRFTNRIYNSLADEMDSWDEVKGKNYGDKLRAVCDNAYVRLAECVAPRKDALNVLNHGDFWINNFMFRYKDDDRQTPSEAYIIDLQLCRFASPALDLQYFITTSLNEEVRVGHKDALLDHYRQELNANLSALGVGDRGLSKEQLHQDFEDVNFFGLHASVSVMCAVVAEPEERLELDSLTQENALERDPMLKAFRGKTFRRLIPGILDHFISKGIL